MTPTCFTIEPTYSGLADQLTQFNAFYKLGLRLGYAYLHTPFVSERSSGRDLAPNSTETDVHEFLGLNGHFERARQTLALNAGERHRLTIRFSDEQLQEWQADDFESLAASVRRLVALAPDPALVAFQLGGERRKAFTLIQAEIPAFPDGLDLPGVYAAARALSPMPTLHRGPGMKILVHVRQGDTAVVRTPWQTVMPTWSSRRDQFTEYKSFADMPSRQTQFDVAEYRAFLAGLLARLGEPRASILVFSDGAARAFRAIESNLHKLAWSPAQVEAFRAAMPGYDQRQFAGFLEIDGTDLQLGEEPGKLRQLLHSALESDLVIVSNQQRLIPKFMASFGRPGAPPVIVLCRGDIPTNADLVRDHQDRFIYVDIDNPDFSALVRRLRR